MPCLCSNKSKIRQKDPLKMTQHSYEFKKKKKTTWICKCFCQANLYLIVSNIKLIVILNKDPQWDVLTRCQPGIKYYFNIAWTPFKDHEWANSIKVQLFCLWLNFVCRTTQHIKTAIKSLSKYSLIHHYILKGAINILGKSVLLKRDQFAASRCFLNVTQRI